MPRRYRKIVLVILDGLRPDAITWERMPHLTALAAGGWQAASAITVTPSITVSALTSLATGVPPESHGVTRPGLPPLTRLPTLRPLAVELARLGVETTVLVPALGGGARWIAGALLRVGGVTRLRTAPASPKGVADATIAELDGNPAPRLVIVYLNEADLAGHAWGWMSGPYFRAVARLDRAVGHLARRATDPDTLFIITADHGGGGVDPRDHDAPHPVNRAIPIVLAGADVAAGKVGADAVHLLDLPPTVLHGFGGTVPGPYAGRVLHEAFQEALVPT